ncbi:MAG: sensor histidine kinase [Petrotogales bacterium]
MIRFLFREKTNILFVVIGLALSISIIAVALFVLNQVFLNEEQVLYEAEIEKIGSMISLGLITSDDIPALLEETNSEDYNRGLEALRSFGYDEYSSSAYFSSLQSIYNFVIYSLIVVGITFIILWLTLMAFMARAQTSFLRETTKELDTTMSGGATSISLINDEGERAIFLSQLDALFNRYKRNLLELKSERKKMKALISFISHELKTPLSSIKMMNELILQDKQMSEDKKFDFLKRTQDDVQRMEWLIHDILNIARIEAGTVRLNFRNHDLSELTLNVISRYKEIARKKNIILSTNLEQNAVVFCDERWISQAIDNLLKNAIEYSPEDGTVSLVTSSSDTFVSLEIKDEGPGMEPEETSKIFNGFYRGEKTVNEKRGTGLGLALARAVVKEHNGDIKVKSTIQKGSSFIVELPVKQGN